MTNIQQYLARIQVDQASPLSIEPPSYSYLAKLQAQHLLAVPFENLSVRRGERIVLDERLLVDKLVARQRGGFCYELNGAFGWLLQQLGFAVTRLSARVYSSGKQQFGPEFDHMALLVQLDKAYLVDVGFGDSARQPLALPDSIPEDVTADVSGLYRLLPVADDPAEFHLQKWEADAWRVQYAFTTAAHELTEYVPMCDYHQSSPQSHFTQRTVCTIATATGRLTLSTDSLTITEGEHKEKITVASPEEFGAMLNKYFGIRS